MADLTDVARRFAAAYADLDPGKALGELVVFAAGHPQRTMLLAYLLSDRLAQGAQGTPALAADVIDDAISRTRAAHQALWGQLNRAERILLAVDPLLGEWLRRR